MTSHAGSINLSRVGQDHWLRPSFGPDAAAPTRELVAARLLTDGPADEQVTVHFVGDVGLDAIFAEQDPPPRSIGWEGLILPWDARRTVRLPAGITVTADATDPGLEALLALRPYAPWILQILDSPHLDLTESLVVRRDGVVVGWVPVWRPSRSTSIVRLVVLATDVHAGEERRLTHLRLAAFAHALDVQCSQGRTVVCWMPDDGDPVNALKLSVAGAARVTHWMQVRVRRDLAPLIREGSGFAVS